MTYILVIWTIIATTQGSQYYDYRPVGDFSSEQRCTIAGEQISASRNRLFVCLKK